MPYNTPMTALFLNSNTISHFRHITIYWRFIENIAFRGKSSHNCILWISYFWGNVERKGNV